MTQNSMEKTTMTEPVRGMDLDQLDLIPERNCARNSDRSITLLTTTFPPRGGSGVQRPYYQAKFLKELGWDVNVFTVSEEHKTIDYSFDSGTSPGVNICRRPAECVSSKHRLIRAIDRKLRRKLFFPDEFRTWADKIARELSFDKNREKILMASVGSPSTLRVLEAVARFDSDNHFKTIVDFRDFWALNQRIDVPEDRRGDSKQAQREEFEDRVLRTVNGIIVVSKAYKKRLMEAYPWLNDDKVIVIENGYVESDFSEAEKNLTFNNKNKYFTIRYTGFLLKDHNPELFFEALKVLKHENASAFKKLRFEYFGGSRSFAIALAENHGVRDNCFFNNYTPHSEIIELMLTADALYLPFARGDGTIGAKTYEYLRSRRPIIPTFSDCDEAKNLLLNFGISGFPTESTPEELAGYIVELMDKWDNGQSSNVEMPANLSCIERFQQTKSLSSWLSSFLTTSSC